MWVVLAMFIYGDLASIETFGPFYSELEAKQWISITRKLNNAFWAATREIKGLEI